MIADYTLAPRVASHPFQAWIYAMIGNPASASRPFRIPARVLYLRLEKRCRFFTGDLYARTRTDAGEMLPYQVQRVADGQERLLALPLADGPRQAIAHLVRAMAYPLCSTLHAYCWQAHKRVGTRMLRAGCLEFGDRECLMCSKKFSHRFNPLLRCRLALSPIAVSGVASSRPTA